MRNVLRVDWGMAKIQESGRKGVQSSIRKLREADNALEASTPLVLGRAGFDGPDNRTIVDLTEAGGLGFAQQLPVQIGKRQRNATTAGFFQDNPDVLGMLGELGLEREIAL